MKKRTYLVATMAAALVALVGCTKDFVAEAPKADAGLAERPEIGAVDLVVGQSTRVERDETSASGLDWKFAADDRVGAMLVDEISGETASGWTKKGGEELTFTYTDYVTNTPKTASDTKNYLFQNTYKANDGKVLNDGAEFYKFSAYIHSNYPYNHVDNGHFTSEAKLVEGHYVFYTPYDESHVTRQPMVVTLPAVQDVSGEYTAIEKFYAGNDPVLLSLSYLSAANAGKQVVTEMQPLFAYPKFTVKNNFKGYLFDGEMDEEEENFISTTNAAKTYTMKLLQMEIYTTATGDPFTYQRQLDLTKLSTVEKWAKSADYYETAPTSAVLKDAAGYGEPEYEFVGDDEDDVMAFDAPFFKDSEDVIEKDAKRVVLDFGGKELKNGATYDFYAVLPAEDFTDGLYAVILVEIDGKEYYIWTNQVNEEGKAFDKEATIAEVSVVDDEESDYDGMAIFSTEGLDTDNSTNYRFLDRTGHGDDKIVLVRGERWPVAEVNADRTAKDHKGNMMTINLEGGKSQIALAAAAEVVTVDKGIKNNEELIAYLNTLNAGVDAKQVTDKDAVTKVEEFYFAKQNTVVINAALIDAIANRLPQGSMTFLNQIPVAGDVLVTKVEGNKVTFKTAKSEKEISYTTTITGDAAKLTSGVNVIANASGTLAVTKDSNNAVCTGVVVFIKAGTATLATTSGTTATNIANIVGINLAAGAKLDVTTTFAGWVVGAADDSNKSEVTIEKGANITNANNSLAYVDNKALAAFGGEAKTVNYSCFGWNIDAIPAASKVNQVTINPTTSKVLEVDADALALVKNLTDGVAIALGTNVSGLTSKSDVTLTNITSMTASNSITWNISADAPVAVYFTGGATVTKATFFGGTISEGAGVTFVKK